MNEKFIFLVTINGHTTYVVEAENAFEALGKISAEYFVSMIEVIRIDPSHPVKITQ